MERLIAFGCSLTFGHGLSDCFVAPDAPGKTCSKLAWPAIVSRFLDKECVNLASPGASNKKIWYNIINYDFKESDVVFILWTYLERYSVIRKKNILDIGPWSEESYYKNYYDELDSVIMTKLFVEHANSFLRSRNVKVYNLVPDKKSLKVLQFTGQEAMHIPSYLAELRNIYPPALDNTHPGLECHETYAKEILDYLNVDNDLPVHRRPGKVRQFIKEKIIWL